MSRTATSVSLTLALALGAATPWACQAQSNAPLTGAMSGGAAQASPVPAAPPAAAPMPARPVVQQVQTPLPQAAPPAAQPTEPAAEAFGDITRGLLAAQADGRRAGAALPVLGATSTAAWNRYLESFSHPIPEWFTKRVQTNNTN